MVAWLGCLQRWIKAPVSLGGVGLNPTAARLAVFNAVCSKSHLSQTKMAVSMYFHWEKWQPFCFTADHHTSVAVKLINVCVISRFEWNLKASLSCLNLPFQEREYKAIYVSKKREKDCCAFGEQEQKGFYVIIQLGEKTRVPGWARTTNLSVNSRTR